jgi:acetoin utilization deacetylase AcuC-like enzyme
LAYDDRFSSYNMGPDLLYERDPYPFPEAVPHPSSPLLISRAKHLIDLYGITDRMSPLATAEATDQQLLAVHTPEHLTRVRDLACRVGGGDTGAGAPIGEGGEPVARRAAGAVIGAVDAVLAGEVDRAYALVRPPGHHALPDRGMGFCVFANVAVAIREAQRVHGIERVLVLDWDVHHGNGTQAIFAGDPSVLFISLHQDDLFPVGWGAVDHQGEGKGTGFTVNIPLPSGGGEALYLAAFDRIVEPVARQYNPELVIISAGQDASVQDPLGRMSLTTSSYRAMTHRLMAIADECAGGRVVVAQEGGYSLRYAPYCTAAIAETLCGVSPEDARVIEPYGERAQSMPAAHAIGLDGEAALQAAVEATRRYWKV